MAEIGILDTIQEQIEIERGKILQVASQQVEDTLQKAEAEVERIKAVTVRGSQTKKEKDLTGNSPVVLRTKQDGMSQAFAKALGQLNQWRNKPEYPNILKQLMLEASSGLSGEVEILVNPADVKLAEKYAAELRIPGKVKGDAEIGGGVVLVQEGKIFNHNSFASRLEKVQNLLSGKVASILYA